MPEIGIIIDINREKPVLFNNYLIRLFLHGHYRHRPLPVSIRNNRVDMEKSDNIEQFGRYKIISILGKGGNGTVYKAVDPVLGRDIALKVGAIPGSESGTPQNEVLAQSLREARLAAKFIHPNIAITYDAGFEKNRFFMALEYIEGKDLQTHTSEKSRLTPIQIMEIIYTICYALDYIHNAGYVHLDIKPANIMITGTGDVKLMDFGISRLLKEKPAKENEVSGSIFYMSPEQSDPASNLDHRSDIFSLGIVFYELLSAKRPFTGETPYQVLYQILHTEPESLENIDTAIPADVVKIVKKALEKNKDDRFQSTIEMAEALLPVIKGKDSAVLSKNEKKKLTYLKRLLFFKHFEESDLEEVIKISSWSFHAAQSWIIEEKKKDRNIYMIVVGRAAVHLGKEIKPVFAGECFGETSVLHSMPRTAKLLAETDCVVMSINANILNQADTGIQVKFLKEFYMSKTLQLVQANLKLIQSKIST